MCVCSYTLNSVPLLFDSSVFITFSVHFPWHLKFSVVHVLLQSVSVMCNTLDVHVKPYEEFPLQTFELPFTLDMQNKNMGHLFNQEPGVGLQLLGRFGGQVQL